MKTSELRTLIREIIEELNLNEGPRDPVIFKAIYMAGGPGSGKSYVVRNLGMEGMGFRTINPDKAYEYMIKKTGHDLATFDIGSEFGQAIRQPAKDLSEKQEIMYIHNRLGLLLDGTGKNFDKIAKHKVALESLGYETAMVFVNADLETAQLRNATRKRKVPTDMVTQFWSDVQKNIGKFQSIFGQQFYIIDNSQSNSTNASIDGEINSVYRKLAAWASQPPRNPIAKRWLEENP